MPDIPGLFKHSIVDVKCTDQNGRIFIVEMQMMWTASFEQRMVFGASQAYVKQLKSGQAYSELRPVYALAIINSRFLPDRVGSPVSTVVAALLSPGPASGQSARPSSHQSG